MIRRTPLKRSTAPIRSTPVRKRRKGPPRRGPASIPADQWRNEKYLDFLRAEGKCRACVEMVKHEHPTLTVDSVKAAFRVILDRCEPMHGPVNGGSSKGPDAGAIPGCRAHHQEQHAIGWPRFEAKYGFSRETEAAVWWTAFQVWREL